MNHSGQFAPYIPHRPFWEHVTSPTSQCKPVRVQQSRLIFLVMAVVNFSGDLSQLLKTDMGNTWHLDKIIWTASTWYRSEIMESTFSVSAHCSKQYMVTVFIYLNVYIDKMIKLFFSRLLWNLTSNDVVLSFDIPNDCIPAHEFENSQVLHQYGALLSQSGSLSHTSAGMSARYISLPAISQKLVQDVKGKRLEGAQQHIQINWKGSQIAKQVEFNPFSFHQWKVQSSDSKIFQLSQWHKKTQKLKYSLSKQKEPTC